MNMFANNVVYITDTPPPPPPAIPQGCNSDTQAAAHTDTHTHTHVELQDQQLMKNPKGHVDWEAAVMRSTQTFEQRCQQHATQTAWCRGEQEGVAGEQTKQAGHSVQAAGHMADRRTETVDVFCLCAMLRTLMTVKIYRKHSVAKEKGRGRGGGAG